MTEHVYKIIEIVGTSSASSDDAIRNAIRKAGESVRNMRWFQVLELRGDIQDQNVHHWQATVKVGFRVDG